MWIARRPFLSFSPLFALVLLLSVGAADSRAQVIIEVNDDVNFRLGVLGQFQADWLEDPDADDTTQNLSVRRIRLLFGGQVAKNVEPVHDPVADLPLLKMNRTLLWLRLATALALVAPAAVKGDAAPTSSIILATTTSTQDSGLLDSLVPIFEKESGTEVKVIAVGTGAALRMTATGDADVVLVHAPAAEKKYVDAGDLIEGRLVMHNDFVIVGPPKDPAGAGSLRSVTDVMRAIGKGGLFVSRGDDSGTHMQEMTLWSSAGIDARSIGTREETGQGMGATLNIADQKRGYTLTDRGTFLSLRKRLGLVILFQGDPSLRNVYHVYLVNPQKHRKVNAAGGRSFIAFLVSAPIQRAIGDFKRQEYGESLFFPGALVPGTRQ